MVYARNSSYVFRRIDDETILVPIRSNAAELENIYVFNEVAARAWELIDGVRTVDDISEIICAEYDVTPETALQDLNELFAELAAISAVDRAA